MLTSPVPQNTVVGCSTPRQVLLAGDPHLSALFDGCERVCAWLPRHASQFKGLALEVGLKTRCADKADKP